MNTGALAILLAATLFGTGGLYVKTVSLPATLLVAFRLFIPAVALLASSQHLRTRLFTQPNKTLALASTVTALRILLWVIALRYAALSKAVFILYTWPIIFTFFNHKIFGERISNKQISVLALSFLGIVTMYSGETAHLNNNDFVGLTLMLIVAVLNAGVFAVFKHELARHSPLEVVMYDNLVGGILFLPFVVYHYDALSLEGFAWGAVYGLSIGLVAYWLLYFGLSKVSGVFASILCYTEVLSATVIGVVVFHEVLTWRVVLGGSIILICAAMARQMQSQRA